MSEMTKAKYFVYRFLDENFNVIYVGRTDNIKNRMNQHFSGRGHLPKECYDSVYRVDYLEMVNYLDMKIKELYYIGKHRPIHNTIDNTPMSVEVMETEDAWRVFTRDEIDNFVDKEILVKKNEQLRTKNRNLKKENKGLNFTLEYYGDQCDVKDKQIKELVEKNEQLQNITEELEQKLRSLGDFLKNSSDRYEVQSGKEYSLDDAVKIIKTEQITKMCNTFNGNITAELLLKEGNVIGRYYTGDGEYKEIIVDSETTSLVGKNPDDTKSNDFVTSISIMGIRSWRIQNDFVGV